MGGDCEAQEFREGAGPALCFKPSGQQPRHFSGFELERALQSAEGMKRALQCILAISVFGVIFSGVLTYGEVFGEQAMSCPAPGAPGTVWGYPACVYGFFMYLAIAITAGLGLFRRSAQPVAPPDSGSAPSRFRLKRSGRKTIGGLAGIVPLVTGALGFSLVYRALCILTRLPGRRRLHAP